jgi:1,4-alpha-glucan branching enzyme
MAEKSAKAKAPGKSGTTKMVGKVATPKVAGKPSAKPAKKKTTFKLHAPGATQVFIAGCFNGWSPTADALMLGGEGTWTCALMLEPGEHEYRFVVDGVWCDDPKAEMRRPNDMGCENCIVVV